MERKPLRTPLIIDARPRGPHGPLAASKVLGRTVLAHLVEASEAAGVAPSAIHARAEEHGALRELLSNDYPFAQGPPPENALILRADRLYDANRLRKVIVRGSDPESAVVWRLDRPHALAGADDELLRRRTFQPLGQYWALAPARALARALAKTKVKPNHLTAVSGLLMLTAAGLTAGRLSGPLAAVCMALALVIDTADGHLARLQGTASEFGRWFDANLDELGDMCLHAAIAWSMFVKTSAPMWLVIGMIYGMGKYLFYVGNTTWNEHRPPRDPAQTALIGPRSLRGLSHLFGHADIRWHLWIVLALIGRLEIGLAAHALYFPARAVAGAFRKAGGKS